MDEDLEVRPIEKKQIKRENFSSWLFFTLKGFVFPCGSISYYKKAVNKQMIYAIIFFFLFALGISLITVYPVLNEMNNNEQKMQAANENGDIQKLVIKNGVAEIDGLQPSVLYEDMIFLAVDTTGEITEIDMHKYSEGILLTRTELHYVKKDVYHVLPLSEINEEFWDPIIVDKVFVDHFLTVFSLVINLFTFLAIFTWFSVIRLVYIMLIGVFMWTNLTFFRKGISYGPVLIVGMFANVPAIYIKSLLKLMNVSFFTLYSLLLVSIWGIVLWQMYRVKDTTKNEPPASLKIIEAMDIQESNE